MGLLSNMECEWGLIAGMKRGLNAFLFVFFSAAMMGCAMVGSSKYFVVQSGSSDIQEVKRKDWVEKSEILYGTEKPPLKAIQIQGAGELTIYPICIGRLAFFGPPFLPIIWAPKWMYATSDPMDEDNISRFMYSGNPSDVSIKAINDTLVVPDDVGMRPDKDGVLFFLSGPDNATQEDVLTVSIYIKSEKIVLEFTKTRVTSWHPMIAPL